MRKKSSVFQSLGAASEDVLSVKNKTSEMECSSKSPQGRVRSCSGRKGNVRRQTLRHSIVARHNTSLGAPTATNSLFLPGRARPFGQRRCGVGGVHEWRAANTHAQVPLEIEALLSSNAALKCRFFVLAGISGGDHCVMMTPEDSFRVPSVVCSVAEDVLFFGNTSTSPYLLRGFCIHKVCCFLPFIAPSAIAPTTVVPLVHVHPDSSFCKTLASQE